MASLALIDHLVEFRQVPSTSYMPLVEPPLALKSRSVFEWMCLCIPVAGWIVAALLESSRRQPRARHISEQIHARTESTIEAWGENPERRAIAAVVCEEIQREYGWPNPHYLPEDPLELLCWRTMNDVELLFALIEAERRLGRKRYPWSRYEMKNGTLSDVVDSFVRN